MTKLQFKSDWEQITLNKIFEIQVYNLETKQDEFIIFGIELHKNKFIAYHEATTKKEAKSKKIAKVEIKIDFDFSIDENLQELYSACEDKINNSEFFQLTF